MAGKEIMVRMGELAVSADADDTLVSLALGSCIGVAMVDRRGGLAGLAHVMLPASPGHRTADPGRFADTAVPELLDRLVGIGALRDRLEVSLVGGAQMFVTGDSSLAIGRRNEEGVRAALGEARLPVVAHATGGTAGRTIRVAVSTGAVTVKEAGGTPWVLDASGSSEAAA
jgi:chemotaxis protein CheD